MQYRIAVLSDGKWKWASKLLSSVEEVELVIGPLLEVHRSDHIMLCEEATPQAMEEWLQTQNHVVERQKQRRQLNKKFNEKRELLEWSLAPTHDEPYLFTFPTNPQTMRKWGELFLKYREGKLES